MAYKRAFVEGEKKILSHKRALRLLKKGKIKRIGWNIKGRTLNLYYKKVK